MDCNNRSGLGLVGTIIAVGVLVVLFGGGPYLMDTIQKSPLLANSTSTNPVDQAKQVMSQLMQKGGEEQKQVEQLGSSSTIDTSTWKTYRNDEYGFEVKIPPTWAIQESTQHQKSLFGDVVRFDRGTTESHQVINVKDVGNKTLEQAIANRFSAEPSYISSGVSLVVAGEKAQQFVIEELGASVETILLHNGKMYQIILDYNRTDNNAENNAVLYTFKFTK